MRLTKGSSVGRSLEEGDGSFQACLADKDSLALAGQGNGVGYILPQHDVAKKRVGFPFWITAAVVLACLALAAAGGALLVDLRNSNEGDVTDRGFGDDPALEDPTQVSGPLPDPGGETDSPGQDGTESPSGSNGGDGNAPDDDDSEGDDVPPQDNVFDRDDPDDDFTDGGETDDPPIIVNPTLPTGPGLTRLERFREIVVHDSALELLMDPTTAQYSALTWLVVEDPAFLDPDSVSSDVISARYKAVLLYFSTNGEDWRVQHDFLTGKDICEWNDGGTGWAFEGILCENGVVAEITLDMNSLGGTIPSEIALFNLKTLGLGANSLQGEIPWEIGAMSNLKKLNLAGNLLNGALPDEFGDLTNLETLLLHDNSIEGVVPSSFQNLQSLQVVFIEDTDIWGDVDQVLCQPGRTYDHFYANCGDGGNVICTCCTHCCNGDGRECEAT